MYLGDCFAEKSNLNPSSRLAPDCDVKPDLVGHFGPLLSLDLLTPAQQDNHQDQSGGASDCLKWKGGCNCSKYGQLRVGLNLYFFVSLHLFVTGFLGTESFINQSEST